MRLGPLDKGDAGQHQSLFESWVVDQVWLLE